MATETKTKKNYNPTFGVFFQDDRFGKGAWVSAPLDEEKFQALMKNVQVGTKLVIKTTTSKNGKPVSFGEILPPLTESKWKKKTGSANTDI